MSDLFERDSRADNLSEIDNPVRMLEELRTPPGYVTAKAKAQWADKDGLMLFGDVTLRGYRGDTCAEVDVWYTGPDGRVGWSRSLGLDEAVKEYFRLKGQR